MKLLSKEEFENVAISGDVLPITVTVVKKKLKQTEMDKVACDKYRRDREVKKDLVEFDRKIDDFANRMTLKEKIAADTHMKEVAIKFLKLANVYEESDYLKASRAATAEKKVKRMIKGL